jgi:hypothetical protein
MATALLTEGLRLVGHTPALPRRHYQAEIGGGLLDADGRLIDWLIGFTLGTLDGQHLDIRVLPDHNDRLTIATVDGLRPLQERMDNGVES